MLAVESGHAMLDGGGQGTKLRVRLLGELELSDSGRLLPLPASRKTRALFVYLLLTGRPVRRDRLCEIFFEIPDDPRAALRWCLTKIRAMLGAHAGLLVADRDRAGIVGDGIVTDLEEMRLCAAGGCTPAALHEMALAAGEAPLPGLDLGGADDWGLWLAAERAEIDRVRAAVLARAAHEPGLTGEQRRLFARGAETLGGGGNGGGEAEADGAGTDGGATAGGPAPAVEQQIRYCYAPDGTSIAYACTGAGAPLVKAANWLNHLELDWTGPVWGELFAGLSADHRLIRYDERGNGLSQWETGDLSFEAFVSDLETVVDTLGLDRFPLLGISQGCAVSIEYACRHPERVSHLMLLGGYAAGWRVTADAGETEQREAVITLARHGWGQDNPAYRQIFSQTFMPTATPEELSWFNEFQKRTATPENAVRFLRVFADIDVRHRLAQVGCPVLVLHARDDQRIPLAHAMELARAIPNAQLVTLDSSSHIPLGREPATQRIIECIRSFVG